MNMHDPPHPGEILREMYFAPLALSVTAAAERLGVSRQTLSEFLNGHNGVSQDMAIRLAKALRWPPKTGQVAKRVPPLGNGRLAGG